jgi:hypothetical protein
MSSEEIIFPRIEDLDQIEDAGAKKGQQSERRGRRKYAKTENEPTQEQWQTILEATKDLPLLHQILEDLHQSNNSPIEFKDYPMFDVSDMRELNPYFLTKNLPYRLGHIGLGRARGVEPQQFKLFMVEEVKS